MVIYRQVARITVNQPESLALGGHQRRLIVSLNASIQFARNLYHLCLTLARNLPFNRRNGPLALSFNAVTEKKLQITRGFFVVDRVVLCYGVLESVSVQREYMPNRPRPALEPSFVTAQHRVEFERGRNQQSQVELGYALTTSRSVDAIITDLPYGRLLQVDLPAFQRAFIHLVQLAPRAIYLAGNDLSPSLTQAGYAQVAVLRVRKRHNMSRFIHVCHV